MAPKLIIIKEQKCSQIMHQFSNYVLVYSINLIALGGAVAP